MFRHQRQSVLWSVSQKQFPFWETKDLPLLILALHIWARWLFDRVRPVLDQYAAEAAQKFWARLLEARPTVVPPGGPPPVPQSLAGGGESPSLQAAFPVVNPKIAEALDRLTLKFCEETNATTSQLLSEALQQTRQAVREATIEGLAIDDLTKRINDVFADAETWRAKRIAVTESSRAVHLAEFISAQESGVVSSLEWLASADACPLCEALAGKQVPLGQPFVTGASKIPEYADVYHAPRHPGCQCTTLEILT